jgi:hypothetical protein
MVKGGDEAFHDGATSAIADVEDPAPRMSGLLTPKWRTMLVAIKTDVGSLLQHLMQHTWSLFCENPSGMG